MALSAQWPSMSAKDGSAAQAVAGKRLRSIAVESSELPIRVRTFFRMSLPPH